MSEFTDKLRAYISACYPALWVNTFEETRVTKEIRAAFDETIDVDAKTKVRRLIYEWDALSGLSIKKEKSVETIKDSTDPLKLFPMMVELSKGKLETLFILKDFHLIFDKAERSEKKINYVRAVRQALPLLKQTRSSLLFVCPINKFPIELSKEIQLIDYDLPSAIAIRNKLVHIQASANKIRAARGEKTKVELPSDIEESAIDAARGLTDTEIELAFSLALIENKEFNSGFVSSVFNEKIQLVKKSGYLTYLPSDISFANVGGLDLIKQWISLRKRGFSKEAQEFGLPYPKGIGLCGIPGCGKTLISKAIAREFGFPLYQLNVGSLFSRWVGETEQNFSNMVKVVDSVGRCVILVDEIEKYMNVGATSGAGDTGTSSRAFGTLLSWLSDRKSPAFIVFTSNNHLALPPELTRKGRFDELFWLDLPNPAERQDILSVILKKYKRDPKIVDIPAIAKASDGFTGAELDSIVKDAMYKAFTEQKEIATDYIIKELASATPQTNLTWSGATEMREKAKGLLKPASDPYLSI